MASVQWNVAEAFDTLMRRLDELYHSRDADAPCEFERRLHFWRDECGLPSEAHSHLQTLRIWRNASLHHDADQWRQKGPSTACRRPRDIWPCFRAPSISCARGRLGRLRAARVQVCSSTHDHT